jgi:hypothetical protein
MPPTKRTKPAGELVRVDAERLHRAILRAGQSRVGVARQLKRRGISITSQYLDQLATGKRGKCRTNVLRGLAEVLKRPTTDTAVMERFLRGEAALVPGVRSVFSFAAEGEVPGEALLAEHEFVMAARTAHRRAFRRVHKDAGVADREFEGRGWRALAAVRNLIDPGRWRALLLPIRSSMLDGGGLTVTITSGDKLRTRAYADAAVHLAAAFEIILEPWLSGKEELDLTTLGSLEGIMLRKLDSERDATRVTKRYE